MTARLITYRQEILLEIFLQKNPLLYYLNNFGYVNILLNRYLPYIKSFIVVYLRFCDIAAHVKRNNYNFMSAGVDRIFRNMMQDLFYENNVLLRRVFIVSHNRIKFLGFSYYLPEMEVNLTDLFK